MVLWPFPVNWQDGYKVSLAFKTEIITSRTGREQRAAWRALPRRTIDFSSQCREGEFLRFKRLLAASQDQEVLVADEIRKVRLAALSAPGASTLQVSSVPGWMVPGRRLVLAAGSLREDCQILSISGTTLTLAAAMTVGFPNGAIVHAGVVGRLPTSLKYAQPTSQVGTVRVTFDVTPGSEPLLDLTAATTFNGREVFATKPNWRDGLSIESLRETETVDYGFGRIETFNLYDFTSSIREGTWLATTVAQAEAIQGLFERMRGRQGEFYVPRWERDMDLSADLAAGTATMRVAGAEVAETFGADLVHKSLMVALIDGTTLYRLVSSIVADVDESVITLSTTWPVNVAKTDVLMVCWAPVCRFATDEIVVDWVTSEVAEIHMSHMALEALNPET